MDITSPTAAAEPRRMTKAKRPFGLMDFLLLVPRGITRVLFPKLVDRYTIGELIAWVMVGWAMFILLFAVSVHLLKLATLMAKGASLDTIGEMLWLRVVLSTVYCLPMAMLLAGLLAFGRLSGDYELIAMQAGGIRTFRVAVNSFVLGLALSFLGLAMNETIIPPAGRRLHHLEDQVKVELKGRVLEDLTDQKAFIVQDYEGGRLARLVAAARFEPEEPPRPALMRDVTYIQYDKGRPSVLIQAERAEWIGPDKVKPGMQQWKFINATSQLMADVTNGDRWYDKHQDMVLTLRKSPQQMRREQKDADQMSYAELGAYIRDLKHTRVKKRVIREFEVQREQKLAIPFAALVFAMIGTPLGIRKQRTSAGFGVGLSVLIILFYYAALTSFSVFGQNGQIDPIAAAWGANVLGLVVGLFLTWRKS